MSPRMAQYGMLWRAALGRVHPHALRLLPWVAVLVTLAIAALAGAMQGPWAALRSGWNAAFGCALVVWSVGYLPGASKLNTPANAHLVPGMRARLVELGVVIWLACIAGLAIGSVGQPFDTALTVTWAMLASLGIGLSAAGSGWGAAILIAIWPLMGFRSIVPEWAQAMMAQPAFLPSVAVALALPGVAAIRTMFPRGGDRHWRMAAIRSPWLDKDPFGTRNSLGFTRWWQAYSLRRALGRRDLGSLLLHGAGPGLHLSGIALGIGLTGVLAAVSIAFAHWSGLGVLLKLLAEIGWILGVLPILMFQMHTMLLAGLGETPAGQSLLRLAPAMPATAPGFNRLLATSVLRSSLAAWTLAVAMAVLCAWASGAGSNEMTIIVSLCCLALPILVVPLYNQARRPRYNPVLQWLLAIALAGACLLLAVGFRYVLNFPVFPTAAALTIVLTAVLAIGRVGAMIRAPFALPAGRLD